MLVSKSPVGTSHHSYLLTSLTYTALLLIAQSTGIAIAQRNTATGNDASPCCSQASNSLAETVGVHAVEPSVTSKPISEIHVNLLQSSTVSRLPESTLSETQIETVKQSNPQLSSSKVLGANQIEQLPSTLSSDSKQTIQAAQEPSSSPQPTQPPPVSIQAEEESSAVSIDTPPPTPSTQPPQSPQPSQSTTLDPIIQIAEEPPQEPPSPPVEQIPPNPPGSLPVDENPATPTPTTPGGPLELFASPTPPAQTDNPGPPEDPSAPSNVQSLPPNQAISESKTQNPPPLVTDSLSLPQVSSSDSETPESPTALPPASLSETTCSVPTSSRTSLPSGSSKQTWPPGSTEPTSIPPLTPINAPKNGKSLVGAWIGTAIGIVAFILLIVAGLYYRHRRNGPKQPTSPDALTRYRDSFPGPFQKPHIPLIAINGQIDRDMTDIPAERGAGALAVVAAAGTNREGERRRKSRPRDTLLDAWKKGVVPEAPPSQEHLIGQGSTHEEGQFDDLPNTGEEGLDDALSSKEQQSQVGGIGMAL